MRLGAIEAGGTKMVLAVVTENGEILERETIPTTLPEETLARMAAYFTGKGIDALGIASFGPLLLDRKSPDYGVIRRTPKPGWEQVNMLKYFRDRLQVPADIDTDVNGAILGEITFGSAKGLENAIYITVGTGIGVGVCLNGKLLHGIGHAEAGHILMKRHPADHFAGNCPFHGDCFEGLASGPALKIRYGAPAEKLAEDPEVWEIEAYYIGQAIADYILTYAPEKVILWGGVMHHEAMLPLIRAQAEKQLNAYVALPALEEYIVTPGLGDDAGIIGAALLGLKAVRES